MDFGETHLVQRLAGQRSHPARRADQNDVLVLAQRVVVKRVRIVGGKLDKAAGDAKRACDGAGLGYVAAVAYIDKDRATRLMNFNALLGRDPRNDRVRRLKIICCVFHNDLACMARVRTGFHHPLVPSLP